MRVKPEELELYSNSDQGFIAETMLLKNIENADYTWLETSIFVIEKHALILIDVKIILTYFYFVFFATLLRSCLLVFPYANVKIQKS